jgi:DNA-binding XRE family transcriptional regulator
MIAPTEGVGAEVPSQLALQVASCAVYDALRDEEKQVVAELFLEYVRNVYANPDDAMDALAAIKEIVGDALGATKLRLAPLPVVETAPLAAWKKFLARRIKSARAKIGMTQQQLARKAGLDQGYVSKLERGDHSPSYKTRRKIERALGRKAGYLDPASSDARTASAARR